MNTKSLLKSLYSTVVVGNQKAIVGFLAPVALGVIAFGGITGDMTVGDAVKVILGGVVTGGSVWFKANK